MFGTIISRKMRTGSGSRSIKSKKTTISRVSMRGRTGKGIFAK